MVAEYDVLVINGVVVTDTEVKEADIAITDGQIAAVDVRGSFRDATVGKVIDAEGGYVTPGGVDAHVHLEEPQLFGKGSSADTFETGMFPPSSEDSEY